VRNSFIAIHFIFSLSFQTCSCVGSSSIEWNKKTIKTFALLEYEQMDQSTSIENQQDTNELSNGLYAKDEGDVV
jgi:hypothetical protein